MKNWLSNLRPLQHIQVQLWIKANISVRFSILLGSEKKKHGKLVQATWTITLDWVTLHFLFLFSFSSFFFPSSPPSPKLLALWLQTSQTSQTSGSCVVSSGGLSKPSGAVGFSINCCTPGLWKFSKRIATKQPVSINSKSWLSRKTFNFSCETRSLLSRQPVMKLISSWVMSPKHTWLPTCSSSSFSNLNTSGNSSICVFPLPFFLSTLFKALSMGSVVLSSCSSDTLTINAAKSSGSFAPWFTSLAKSSAWLEMSPCLQTHRLQSFASRELRENLLHPASDTVPNLACTWLQWTSHFFFAASYSFCKVAFVLSGMSEPSSVFVGTSLLSKSYTSPHASHSWRGLLAPSNLYTKPVFTSGC